jgi:predicted peroxiredoxin
MKLGILVNTNDHLEAIAGITRASTTRGHHVTIFAMDEGTRLLEEAEYVTLAELEGVSMSYCEHSALELSVNTDGLSDSVESSSQYSNAAMNHSADKVLVL